MTTLDLNALLAAEAKASDMGGIPTRHMQPAGTNELSIIDLLGSYIISGHAADVEFYALARNSIVPLAEALKVAVEALRRSKLEVEVNRCDCGEPWFDSDLNDILRDALAKIATLVDVGDAP